MKAEKQSKTIIFLHGWTMNGSAFDQQIELLGDEFQCFAPDLPGHGSSAHLTASIDASADFLRDLINNNGLNDVLLVGWSMGAAIAWNYLRRFGSTKVAGLITVDMSQRSSTKAIGDGVLLGGLQKPLPPARRTCATIGH